MNICKYKKCVNYPGQDLCSKCARAYANKPPGFIERYNQPRNMFLSFKERDRLREWHREVIGYSLLGTMGIIMGILFLFLALFFIYI